MATTTFFTSCEQKTAQAPRRPNIVFVFADDHAYQAVSAYGSKINKTPNIDRLAEEGIRFDRSLVTNSICAPARAVILSGKYSHLNGVLDNRLEFDGSQQTFPKLLHRCRLSDCDCRQMPQIYFKAIGISHVANIMSGTLGGQMLPQFDRRKIKYSDANPVGILHGPRHHRFCSLAEFQGRYGPLDG